MKGGVGEGTHSLSVGYKKKVMAVATKRKIDAILLEPPNVATSLRPIQFNMGIIDMGTTSGADSRATISSGDLPSGIHPRIVFEDLGPVPLFSVSFRDASSSFIVPLHFLNSYLTSKAFKVAGYDAFPDTIDGFVETIKFIGFLYGATKARHGRKDVLSVSVQADQPGIMNFWPRATSGTRVGFMSVKLDPKDEMFGHTLSASAKHLKAPTTILQVISHTSGLYVPKQVMPREEEDTPPDFQIIPNSKTYFMRAGRVMNPPNVGSDNYVSVPLMKRALKLPPYLCPNVPLTQIYCTI